MAKNVTVAKKAYSPLLLRIIIYYYYFMAGLALFMFLLMSAIEMKTATFTESSNLISTTIPEFYRYQPFLIGYYNFPLFRFVQIPLIAHAFIVAVLFAVLGYLLYKRTRAGFYIGLFISIYTLIMGMTIGLYKAPWVYVKTIFTIDQIQGIYAVEFLRVMLILNLVLVIIIPFYLFSRRKLFLDRK